MYILHTYMYRNHLVYDDGIFALVGCAFGQCTGTNSCLLFAVGHWRVGSTAVGDGRRYAVSVIGICQTLLARALRDAPAMSRFGLAGAGGKGGGEGSEAPLGAKVPCSQG